jgi:hypothetical protein
MPVSKDFRVKKGLVVGQNIDATSGNLSAIDIDASGTFTAGTFEPVDVTATNSVSSPSISADNFYGNIIDAELTATSSVSSPSISADNFYGNVTDVTFSDLSITGGLSSDGITLTNVHGNIGLGTLDSVKATITSAASATIFTIPIAQYRSGKIVIQAVSVGVGTNPSAQMEASEILFIQGPDENDNYNTTVRWCEYATVGIGSTTLATYTGVVNGDNVEFRATNNHSQTLNFVSSISQLYSIT